MLQSGLTGYTILFLLGGPAFLIAFFILFVTLFLSVTLLVVYKPKGLVSVPVQAVRRTA